MKHRRFATLLVLWERIGGVGEIQIEIDDDVLRLGIRLVVGCGVKAKTKPLGTLCRWGQRKCLVTNNIHLSEGSYSASFNRVASLLTTVKEQKQ